MVTLAEYLFTLLHCVVLSMTSCSANRKSTVHNDDLSFQSPLLFIQTDVSNYI